VGDCAVTLISSDVDVDRIDYLLRDSHYAGQGSMLGSTIKDLSEMWQFKCVNGRFSCELTEAGIRFAETLLMLRRDNYRRIVFDSAHMAATAMFEKAMHYAVQQQSSPFSKMVKAAILASKKWSGDKLPKTVIQPVMVIFGLVDFEALHLLETSSEGSQYLIRGIRFGQLYESAAKRHWEQIHHSIRRRLVGLKNHKDTFQFRRDCEKIIATAAKIDERHVAVHALPVRAPGPLLFGVYDGRTLHDASELSRFLVDDFFKQYTIEVFADHQLSPPQVQTIQDTFAMIFERGEIEPST
jgi:HD superfamily phosphohydrolase